MRVERRVNRPDNQTVPLGLRDQHAVERIAMRTGQPAGPFRVDDTDRQTLESLTGNGLDCLVGA